MSASPPGRRAPCLRPVLLAGLVGAAAIAIPQSVHARQDADLPAPCARVRATGPTAARLLGRGIDLSSTLRRLVASLEQTDLIVHVETAFRRKVPGIRLVRGETRVAASTPHGRFVRVTISVPDVECELLSTTRPRTAARLGDRRRPGDYRRRRPDSLLQARRHTDRWSGAVYRRGTGGRGAGARRRAGWTF